MALSLSGTVCRYNGFDWPISTQTTGISVVPVYDQAGRTVIYSRIRISLRCVLSGPLMDTVARLAVQLLNRPAYSFIYSGHGYGLSVNIGSVRDVAWGPKPSEATIKPLGGGNAVVLTWSIEVGIPDGRGARYAFSPLEYAWSASYDIDAAGYTTRSVSGFLRIPMTRNGADDRALADNIDTYREDVYPPLLEDFRRGEKSWVINAAKDRADWHVVDEQFGPNKLPVGIVEASADHTVSSVPGQLVKWTGVISGTYEIARNGSATSTDAIVAFFALAKDRINQTIQSISRGQASELRTSGASGAGKIKPCVLPVSMTISEPEIYGRTKVRLSLTYSASDVYLSEMLRVSGQWRPAPGAGWQAWANSMGDVLGPRGHAQLAFDSGDDKIVDLFQPGVPVTTLGSRLAQSAVNLSQIPRDIFPEPTPDGSWLEYRNVVYQETDNGVAEVRTLPTELRTAEGDLYGGATSTAVNAGLGAFEGLWSAGQEISPFYFPPARTPSEKKKGGTAAKQQPQRRARQGGAIYLIGHAVRVRYAIPAPELTRWGDATLTPANRPDRGEGFSSAVVGNCLWPIIAARWRLRYLLDTPPSDTPPALPNPLQGGGGEDAANLGRAVGDVMAGFFGGR